jgi:hypothetical protein
MSFRGSVGAVAGGRDRSLGGAHSEAAVAVVGAGADVGGRQGAVDQERVAGAHLAQGVGRGEPRGGGGERGGPAAEVAGD